LQGGQTATGQFDPEAAHIVYVALDGGKPPGDAVAILAEAAHGSGELPRRRTPTPPDAKVTAWSASSLP
jgi:hypothetical protein